MNPPLLVVGGTIDMASLVLQFFRLFLQGGRKQARGRLKGKKKKKKKRKDERSK